MLRAPALGVIGAIILASGLTLAAGSRTAARAMPHRSALHAPSDSQADLGRRWFAASCEACHAVDDVSSPDFKAKWGGRTAYDLFDQIARTMPGETPGSLPRRAYVDIVAYLMQQNGVTTAVPLADDDAALTATILQFAPPPRS